jgi:hypothetical protein
MPMKRLLLLTLSVGLLALPLLVMAQEEEAAAPAEPVGLTTLVFLLGLGAVVVVGGRAMLRDTFNSDKGSS